uniref:Ig-like domain-containing protein n=1 Tax=Oreochromis niloticus TaxID=8128 RepID=A0A669CUP2_ORENI
MYKMSGFGHVILCYYILGYIWCSSSAWQVTMPSKIKGLLGSCLVIPCSYDYDQYPPKRPDRVVWYQYVSEGYPIVSDNWNRNDVLDIFKGRTSVYSSSHHRTCSLLIDPVTLADHSQKLYPWVDPENVGWRTYRFYDTTVTVEVVGTADPPVIEIFGNKVVGQSVTVQCSVYHTCPNYPPSLRLNIPLRNERLTHSPLSDGRSKTMVTTTLFIEKEYQTVECYVQHRGGRSASASKTLTSQCSISGLTVSSALYEFLEGDQSTVTCTVSYTCYRNIPTLTWNYGNMPASSDTSKLSGGAQWRTVSTLTFTASANDNGRSLICYARFPGGQTKEASITLRVKRNILNLGWSFTAPATITGLKGSCLIIPCKFSYKNSQPNDLQVMWYLYQINGFPAVFKQGGSVISKFDGRTSLIGSVVEQNCSLKIERLEMSHNHDRLYPWIDKNSITSYGTIDHTFYDGSTELVVSEHAPEPQLSIIGILRVGEQGTVSCSVRHTCFSAPPTLTLKDLPGIDQNMDTLVSEGIWERKIVRTWTAEEEHQSVSCAVNYPAGQSAKKSIPLTAECSISPLNISSTSDQTQEVNISMRVKTSPEKPVMTPVPEEVDAGSTITVSCSVTHTCSSHPPVFSWTVSHLTSEVSHIMMSRGTWQTTSTITFIVTEGDGVRNLTCNAIFWRNREQAHTVSLNVKGSLMYRFKSSAPVAFPVSFRALIIITLAAVFAVFIWRKRKHTDESLKPPPRPEQRRSLWDRLSRQSFWSRFSRRQDRTANISVAYTKNSSNVTCGAESKPRCPSPKDNRRRPSPFNPEVSGIAVNDKIQIIQI